LELRLEPLSFLLGAVSHKLHIILTFGSAAINHDQSIRIALLYDTAPALTDILVAQSKDSECGVVKSSASSRVGLSWDP
jgi:hypothetical protein